MFYKIYAKIKFLLVLTGFIFAIGVVGAQDVDAQVVMDMSTPATTKYVGHTFNVALRVDTNNVDVDTISVRNLNYDASLLELTNTNIQTIFSSQIILENQTDNVAGTKRLDLGRLPSTPNLNNNSPQNFAILTFRVLNAGPGSTTLDFDFDATPTTTGTFIGGVKNLTTASPLTVNLEVDTTPPFFENCTPVAGATDVPVITSVQCDVRDLETGVHLGGTTLTVNGVTYGNSGPNTYSAVPIANGFRLTVTPAVQLPYFSTIEVEGVAQDNAFANGPILARNTGFLSLYTFQTEQDVDAPQIYSRNPNSGGVNAPTGTEVRFNVRDIKVPDGYPGTGVDLSTLTITVSAPGWGSEVFTESGTNSFIANPLAGNHDYFIRNIMPNPFPENTLVTVQIQVCDLTTPTANCTTDNYTFTTIDTTPPECEIISPEPGAVTVPTNGFVEVRCTDDGVGVDISAVSLQINGVVYTSSGTDAFSFSGTPADYLIAATFPPGLTEEFAFEVILNATDNNNNSMDQIAFGLATGVGEVECQTPTFPEDNGDDNGGDGDDTPPPTPPTIEQCIPVVITEYEVIERDADQVEETETTTEVEQTTAEVEEQIEEETKSGWLSWWLLPLLICPWILLLVVLVLLLRERKKNEEEDKAELDN